MRESLLPAEKENRRIGVTVTVVIHLLLLIFFLFWAAYKPPYPPNPGIPGVELNFGLVDAGMGDVQKENTKPTKSTEDSKPEKAAVSQPKEEVKEQNTPETKEAIVKGENIQAAPVESPHVVKEQSDLSSKNRTDKKVTEASKPKVDNPEKSEKDGADGKAGDKAEAAGGSQGNKNVMGDQGDKKGSIDARAMYGNPGTGGGGGPDLKMDGWNWDRIPDKVDASSERGYVIFEFKVDDYGIVEWARTVEKTVSPSVEKFYKDQLMNTTFSRTGGNINNYSGRVKFEVRAH